MYTNNKERSGKNTAHGLTATNSQKNTAHRLTTTNSQKNTAHRLTTTNSLTKEIRKSGTHVYIILPFILTSHVHHTLTRYIIKHSLFISYTRPTVPLTPLKMSATTSTLSPSTTCLPN